MDTANVVNEFTLDIEQIDGYLFRTHFDKGNYVDLEMDEPAPFGRDTAPNPVRVLAAAVGNCLTASLLLSALKSRIDVGPVSAKVKTTLVRNERGRVRVGKIEVEIDPNISPEDQPRVDHCCEAFEDLCVVTESVRHGIDVAVTLKTADVPEPALA